MAMWPWPRKLRPRLRPMLRPTPRGRLRPTPRGRLSARLRGRLDLKQSLNPVLNLESGPAPLHRCGGQLPLLPSVGNPTARVEVEVNGKFNDKVEVEVEVKVKV